MKPIKTDYANVTFVAEGCLDLPGTLAKDQDGIPHIETCWELSAEELEDVKKTGRVFLNIIGHRMPPVLLTTASIIAVEGNEG